MPVSINDLFCQIAVPLISLLNTTELSNMLAPRKNNTNDEVVGFDVSGSDSNKAFQC